MITIVAKYRCGFCKGNLVVEGDALECILCTRRFKIPTKE